MEEVIWNNLYIAITLPFQQMKIENSDTECQPSKLESLKEIGKTSMRAKSNKMMKH
jgi:hypothetical protein